MTPPVWQLIYNAVAFQAGWLSCVVGGSRLGVPVVGILLTVHLCWLARPGEWRWLIGFTALGLLVDGGFALAEGFHFTAASTWWPLPLWLWALWPLFASLIGHSLAWLWRHPWLAMLGGAVSGPMSYYGGAQLAGIELAAWLLPAEALVWAALCRWLCHYHGSGRG